MNNTNNAARLNAARMHSNAAKINNAIRINAMRNAARMINAARTNATRTAGRRPVLDLKPGSEGILPELASGLWLVLRASSRGPTLLGQN